MSHKELTAMQVAELQRQKRRERVDYVAEYMMGRAFGPFGITWETAPPDVRTKYRIAAQAACEACDQWASLNRPPPD